MANNNYGIVINQTGSAGVFSVNNQETGTVQPNGMYQLHSIGDGEAFKVTVTGPAGAGTDQNMVVSGGTDSFSTFAFTTQSACNIGPGVTSANVPLS